jgi:hypothetical protein
MWLFFAPLALNSLLIVRFYTNKAASLLSIWWHLLLSSHSFCFCNQHFPFFGSAPERPAVLGLFRDSLCGVLVNTMPGAQCLFLDFGLGCSAQFEGSGLIFSIGRYPLYPGACFRVAGLAACAELRLKCSVPTAVGFSQVDWWPWKKQNHHPWIHSDLQATIHCCWTNS